MRRCWEPSSLPPCWSAACGGKGGPTAPSKHRPRHRRTGDGSGRDITGSVQAPSRRLVAGQRICWTCPDRRDRDGRRNEPDSERRRGGPLRAHERAAGRGAPAADRRGDERDRNARRRASLADRRRRRHVSGSAASIESQVTSGAGEAQLEGRVESLPPTMPALTFKAAGRTVRTDSSTRFVDGSVTRSFGDLQIGMRVHVKGSLSGDTFMATRRVPERGRRPRPGQRHDRYADRLGGGLPVQHRQPRGARETPRPLLRRRRQAG